MIGDTWIGLTALGARGRMVQGAGAAALRGDDGDDPCAPHGGTALVRGGAAGGAAVADVHGARRLPLRALHSTPTDPTAFLDRFAFWWGAPYPLLVLGLFAFPLVAGAALVSPSRPAAGRSEAQAQGPDHRRTSLKSIGSRLRPSALRARAASLRDDGVTERVGVDSPEQCCGVCEPASLGRIGIMFARLDALPSAGTRSRTAHGQRTSGGRDIRIASTLPPVIRPNLVPRSCSRLNST